MAWRIVFANNKGGAGKSMLTSAMAAALARYGFRIKAVDVDPQGNLTRRLGHDEATWPPEQPTMADALRLRSQRPVPIADIEVACAWEHPLAANITVLPSVPQLDGETGAIALEQRALEAGMENSAVLRLRRQLDGFDDDADFTLIDVPPGLGHLTAMALAAADAVVIVLQPEYDYVQGAVRAATYVELEREDLGRPDLRVIGVVVTNVQDTATHRAQMANLPHLFADGILWDPPLPHRATLSAANSDALPIELVRGRRASELADMFEQHARHLLAALGIPVPEPLARPAGETPVAPTDESTDHTAGATA